VFAICFFSRLFSTDVTRIYVMMAPLVVGLSVAYLSEIFEERGFVSLVMLFFLAVAGNHSWVEGRTWLLILHVATLCFILRFAKPLPPDRVPA